MMSDLALDALKGVVNRLAVAAKSTSNLFVGMAVEVQGQNPRLELG
jgi:hypothetical protein